MGNYKNFDLVVYFVAGGTANTTKEQLEADLAFFDKYVKLDKVYLEPFRGESFATKEQVMMVKNTFLEHGIKVEGGITTCHPDVEGKPKKQRLFNTFCYNDEDMLETLKKASRLNGECFDAFIIDDFYFTNCACKKCVEEKNKYNAAHGITDGSWQAYRSARMLEVSKEYMIKPAKEANPNCKITIKFPNWMESYQETGYDPLTEREIFDAIYTGTETRDPVNTDQHLPRYLSYSILNYIEEFLPGKNGGGWFDPYDCRIMEHYLEQAYLTGFGKAKELMMFCFQSLVGSPKLAALGVMLEKLDCLMGELGKPVGVPVYLPDASQGEDNLQDYLGMQGIPTITTPFFPENAKTIMLTESSAYDTDIVDKLERFVMNGGKAIVTPGFLSKTMDKGIKGMTSIRMTDRHVKVSNYSMESPTGRHNDRDKGTLPVQIPVLSFRNNATWAALLKGVAGEESYTMLARDTYGDGQMLTLNMPESFSDIKHLPGKALAKLRYEFSVNGIYFEGGNDVSIFIYDNDTFVLYNYVDNYTYDKDVLVHIKGAKSLSVLAENKYIDPLFCANDAERAIKPLYINEDEAVFKLPTASGEFKGYRINR